MITIQRKRRSGHTEHNIYTEEEAKAQGIEYVPWREATPGDWAITDDGYVMECENVYETNGKSNQVVLSGGRQWTSGNAEINFEKNHEIGIYTASKPRTWQEREARLGRTKRAMKVIAASIIETGKPDLETAAFVYRQDEEIPVATLKRLLRQEEVQKVLRDELRKMYEDEDFNERSVIQELKELRQEAKEKKDLSNWNRGLETSIKLLDMEPGKETKVDEFEIDVSRQITSGNVEEERARMKGKSTTTDGELPKPKDDMKEIEEAEYEEE